MQNTAYEYIHVLTTVTKGTRTRTQDNIGRAIMRRITILTDYMRVCMCATPLL
jgi:hypothetical protein